MINVKIYTKSKESHDVTIFLYIKADWDRQALHYIMADIMETPLSVFLKNRTSITASFFSEWILSNMPRFIAQKNTNRNQCQNVLQTQITVTITTENSVVWPLLQLELFAIIER